MAHATDHQSRMEPALNMKAVVLKLVVRTMLEHKDWSEVGMRQYCMSNFSKMGLTNSEYDRIVKWIKEH